MAERSFAAALARIVRKRTRSLLEDGAAALERGREAELHDVRIAVKRLRYTLECAVPLAPDATRPALELLAKLQEHLGSLADGDTFGRTYAGMLDGLTHDDPRRSGLETLAAASRQERERQLAALRTLWKGNGEAGYPDRLAASISAALASISPKPEP
jgi:CHAD domain-containing protein